MHYKGYWGSVEFSEQDALFFGKVMGVRSLISYEGTTAKALVANFHGAVDDYLDLREQRNETPEKAYRGSFNVRVSPELHEQAALYANASGTSLNQVVERALAQYVRDKP